MRSIESFKVSMNGKKGKKNKSDLSDHTVQRFFIPKGILASVEKSEQVKERVIQ